LSHRRTGRPAGGQAGDVQLAAALESFHQVFVTHRHSYLRCLCAKGRLLAFRDTQAQVVLVHSAVGGNIKLIQISDSHINAAAGARLRGADVDANLATVVDHILANHGDAYGVVHTGDLVQDDGPEAYARVREALSRLRRPV